MKYLMILVAMLGVVACGGGSSSSEPSGTTYNGSQQVTVRFVEIGESTTSTAPFRLIVSGNSVFITDTAGDNAVTANGTLSGSNFTATSNSSFSEDGVTCTFNWTYTGTISGNVASGRISGTLDCTDGSASLSAPSSGTFTGNLATATKQFTGKGLSDLVSKINL